MKLVPSALKPEKVMHVGCGRSHTIAACCEYLISLCQQQVITSISLSMVVLHDYLVDVRS